MTADAFIQCRVPTEMKSLVRALAERQGITESRLVKQFLEVVLQAAALADVPAAAAPDKVSRETRLYVRLAAEDWRRTRSLRGRRSDVLSESRMR